MIRVLIVDSSALHCQVIKQGLSKDPELKVIGLALDTYTALEKIDRLNPDVLLLENEISPINSIEFMRSIIPEYHTPVVMLSSQTEEAKELSLAALQGGAIDIIFKPTSQFKERIDPLIQEIITKIKFASKVNVNRLVSKKIELEKLENAKNANRNDILEEFALAEEQVIFDRCKRTTLPETTQNVIAIGASIGGTEATRIILDNLPPSSPGIVVVQHMPEGFTKMYAESLNRSGQLEVIEGKTGDRVKSGRAIIAPGDQQMIVKKQNGNYIIECFYGNTVNGHRPSVTTLFDSVAESVGVNAMGIILTGMGKDGSDGMLKMKEFGAFNIAQDEDSALIFSMPKGAIELGCVDEIVSLKSIPERIVSYFCKKAEES